MVLGREGLTEVGDGELVHVPVRKRNCSALLSSLYVH